MGLAMYISFCCIGILTINCLLGVEAASCPRGWLQTQGNCYGYFDRKLTWSRAEAECQSYNPGCHLASVLSLPETTLVAEHVEIKQNSPSPVWIGLHDVSGKRQWRWADESVYNYEAWKAGEPNNLYGNENCVELSAYTNFKEWNDNNCGNLNAYICKYQL